MSEETLSFELVSEPDEVLMTFVAAGDDRPFELLMRRHAGRLATFLYRLTGVEEDVEDLVQETFLRAYRARGRYRLEASFVSWVYEIARNAAWNWRRTRRRKPLHRGLRRGRPGHGSTTLLGTLPGHVTSPSGALAAQELAARIDEALQGLSPKYREAVVLCDFERLDYEGAARIAGCSVKTLGSRLARGREQLRRRIGDAVSG